MVLSRLTSTNKLGSNKFRFAGLFLLISLFLLTGCSSLYDPEASQEFHTDALILLENHQTVKQTLNLHQASLSKFRFWAAPSRSQATNEKINFYLYTGSDKATLLYSTTVAYPSNQQVSISIPEEIFIPPGSYSIVIQADRTPIWLFGSKLDSYPEGGLYFQDTATGYDLGFSIDFRYTFLSFLSDAKIFLIRFPLFFPLFALLIAPGFLFLKAIKFNLESDSSLRLFLAITVSLSFYPILTSLDYLVWVQVE